MYVKCLINRRHSILVSYQMSSGLRGINHKMPIIMYHVERKVPKMRSLIRDTQIELRQQENVQGSTIVPGEERGKHCLGDMHWALVRQKVEFEGSQVSSTPKRLAEASVNSLWKNSTSILENRGYKIHSDFRDVKIRKICILESVNYGIILFT